MNPGQHPETLDRLAARYALGLMRGRSRRRFERYARRSATVRAAIWLWQERLASMTELVAPVQPDPRVWRAIEAQLDRSVHASAVGEASGAAESQSSASADGLQARLRQLEDLIGGLRDAARRWRLATLSAATIAVLAALGVAQQFGEARRQPLLDSVAVLADERASVTLVVTIDRHNGRIGVRRAGDYREASDKSLQLWALAPAGPPRSLGLVGADAFARQRLDAQAIDAAQVIAVSLEAKGGVGGQSGPSGPVLFKGPLVPASL